MSVKHRPNAATLGSFSASRSARYLMQKIHFPNRGLVTVYKEKANTPNYLQMFELCLPQIVESRFRNNAFLFFPIVLVFTPEVCLRGGWQIDQIRLWRLLTNIFDEVVEPKFGIQSGLLWSASRPFFPSHATFFFFFPKPVILY